MGYFFHTVRSELFNNTNIYFVDSAENNFIVVNMLFHLINLLNIFNLLTVVILSKEIFMKQLNVLSFIYIAVIFYLTYGIKFSP
jgi:hypothetical protein